MNNKLTFLLSLTFLGSILFGLLASLSTALPLQANDEKIFNDAIKYTVEIRTRVEIPFVEDDKGINYGAGFLIDKKLGWILTNAHVASYSPSDTRAAFHQQDWTSVEKVYVDPYLDMAIIKFPLEQIPEDAKEATLECNLRPSMGHPVGAFGHPWGYSFTGTRGIISGFTAGVEGGMLQTDAPINGGNSGGPLISMSTGKVLGINTSSVDDDGNQNTNFSERIDHVCKILRLIKNKKNPSPPKLEVVFQKDIITDTNKLIIAKSYLLALPLKEGDIILNLEGFPSPIKNERGLIHELRGNLDNVRLRVLRSGRNIDVVGKLDPRDLITDRKGVFFSGVLISEEWMEDSRELKLPEFVIHSVESSSTGQMEGFGKYSFISSVDGKQFEGLDDLFEILSKLKELGKKAVVKLKSFNEDSSRGYFDYNVISVDVENLKYINGP
jgi:S1-C subfamily serine protease